VSERVLIIDDERSLAQALAVRLKVAGYTVSTAESGEAGLSAALAKPQPDAIILDVRMPDIDGFEVNLRLKSQPETVRIPVIFLSANVQDTARQTALAAGAWTYLTKPYDWRDVIGAVKAAIANDGPGPERGPACKTTT
jgi:DNA-binding response OmpR family regulator